MVGWHHRLDGHEFSQAPGDGEGQGSLACCSPWGSKELDMTEQLNNTFSQLKTLKKLGKERNWLNRIKTVCEKSTACIILSSETESFSL